MNKKRETYNLKNLLVDASTGEVIKEIYENDKIKIITPKKENQTDYLKFKSMKENRDELSNLICEQCGSFYFNFFNAGLDTIDIKDSIKLRFLYLCTYTNYSDKGLYIIYDNGKMMDRGGISDALNISDKEVSVTINTLVKCGLIIKENRYYKINKTFVHRGELNNLKTNLPHSRIFDNGLRELYKNCDGKQHKQLYYLFKLLPYISLKFNAICKNVEAEDPETIAPLKLSEICELVGYSTSNAKKFEREMLKLRLFDQYAILGIKNGGGMWYKVNPRILYAGAGRHLDEFKELLSTDFGIK